MNAAVTGIGVVLILIGGLGVAGVIPLSIFNTYSVSSPTVTCGPPSSSGSAGCESTVTVTDNNSTQTSVLWTVFGCKVCDGLGEGTNSLVQTMTTSAGQSQPFSQSLGNLACGQYFLVDYVTDSAGINHLSYEQSTTFSPCLWLAAVAATQVANGDPGTVTVTPSPVAVGSLPAHLPTVSAGVYSPGTGVKVTDSYTAAQGFQCWLDGLGSGACTTNNPWSFTLNQNVYVVAQVGGGPPASCGCINVEISAGSLGSVSPTGATIYSTPSAGSTSATFTVTLNPGNYLQSVSLQPAVSVTGGTSVSLPDSSPVVVTYAQASQALGGAASGTADVFLGIGVTPHVNVLDNAVNPNKVSVATAGCGSVTSFGSCVAVPGTNVTVTASNIISGYLWGGWIRDGSVVTKSLSYSFTVGPESTSVMPNILLSRGQGCSTDATGQETCTSVTVTTSGLTCIEVSGSIQTCTGSSMTSGGPGPSTCSPGAFTVSTNAGVTVTVVNKNNDTPIAGATVTGGGLSVVTNSQGMAALDDIPVPNPVGSPRGTIQVTVTDEGYAAQTGSVTITQGQCASALVQLVPSGGFSLGGDIVGVLLIVAGSVVSLVGAVMPSKREGS